MGCGSETVVLCQCWCGHTACAVVVMDTAVEGGGKASVGTGQVSNKSRVPDQNGVSQTHGWEIAVI